MQSIYHLPFMFFIEKGLMRDNSENSLKGTSGRSDCGNGIFHFSLDWCCSLAL